MTDALLSASGRVAPIVAFLLTVTVVAELSDRAGVFDAAAHRLARLGGGRMWLLWPVFAVFATACTIVLSLDTTAVLLTPVGIALARRIGVAERPFALTTLWIANTGSLLLPVSNLTNLLALGPFAHMGIDHAASVRLMAAPAVACIVATLLLLALLHRRDLTRRYPATPPSAGHDPVLRRVAAITCLALGPAFAAGLPPWLVATVAAAVLVVASARRAPQALRNLPVPWVMAAGFAALTLLVTWAHDAGHLAPLVALAGTGTGPADLARVAATGAVTANLVDNLPAYLALEPAALGEPARLAALLVGTNAGPLVTPWASLATLLWLERCRAAGVTWRLWRLGLAGLACALLAVAAGVAALALA